MSSKSAKPDFQSEYSMSKLIQTFQIFFQFRIIILKRTHFLLKSYFDNFNFWNTLVPKIFLTNCHSQIHKIWWFPLSMVIFGQNFCFFRTHHLWNSTTKMTLFPSLPFFSHNLNSCEHSITHPAVPQSTYKVSHSRIQFLSR